MKYFAIPVGIFIGLLLALSIATIANAEILPPHDIYNETSCPLVFDNSQFAIQSFTFDQDYYLDDFSIWIAEKHDDLEQPDMVVLFREKNGNNLIETYINQFTVGERLEEYNYPLGIQIDSTKEYEFLFLQSDSSFSNVYFIGMTGVEGIGDSGCYDFPTHTVDENVAITLNGHILSTGNPFKKEWLYAMIPTAFASTTCVFLSPTATTTTAECSDSKISNPTQDIATGLLFLIGIALLTVGSLYRKPRKDR